MTNQQDTALLPVEQEGDDRFSKWPTQSFIAQCRMQACDNLDPEYSRWMIALAERLAQLSAIQPKPSGEADEATVERVTQAIADAQFGGSFNGLEWPEAWEHFETLARAAIAALSERAGVGEEVERLREALDAAHFYIDASDGELRDLGITRADALLRARELRAALGVLPSNSDGDSLRAGNT